MIDDPKENGDEEEEEKAGDESAEQSLFKINLLSIFIDK